MPEKSIAGVLTVGTPSGPACPPGTEIMIADISLYQVFSKFEGLRVSITVTVLDDGPPTRKGPGTIRDLTVPRY